MTRQRLREGSIKWETHLSMESFALKIIKKIEMLAFRNKIKYIVAYIPEKIKLFIDNILKKEIEYFQKKYNFKIDFVADNELILPEYRINLLNKNKKIVSKVENLKKIEKIKIPVTDKVDKIKVQKDKEENKTKKITSKRNIRSPRTLWVRRKKRAV